MRKTFFWKLVGCGLLAPFFCFGPSAKAAASEPWQTGSPAFSEEGARRESGPIVLYFTAKWCGFCQQMQRTTLTEPGVISRLRQVRAYKLDFDVEKDLARRFGVDGIPAFVLTNSRGEVIDLLSGARPAADFLRWLTQAEAEFGERVKTAAAVAEALRLLPAEAHATDATTRERAVETLWALAGRAAPFERAAAVQILTTLLAESGSDLLWRIGLTHDDLAVRVAAANLLEQSSNGKRRFDPWANEQERTATLVKLGF